MPNKGYLPSTDADFDAWLRNFSARITIIGTALGLPPAIITAAAGAYAAWRSGYEAHITAQNAARGVADAKDDLRDGSEDAVRAAAGMLQKHPDLTNQQREELGITVPSGTRTPLSDQIVLAEPPPIIEAKCTGAKTVRLDWYPTQAPGQSEALPHGIDGVNIWVAEGGIPSDESQWRFLAMDTNSPYIHNVANDATATMAYKAQWFDRRKRMGPFGAPIVVAVTA